MPQTVVRYLERLREPIAEYQCARGLSKLEKLSFAKVIVLLCKHAYNAILAIFTMLYELTPFIDGLLYFARFLVDKSLDICEAEDCTTKIILAVLFVLQVFILFFLLFLIFAVIMWPVIALMVHYLGKLWNLTKK